MAWIGAAIGAVGGLLSSASSDGGGGGSSSSGPWAAAQPWMARQAIQGNALQDLYTQSPFNQQQLAAYNNQFTLSDYAKKILPGLLQSLGSQQLGYDRNNPTARPQAFNWGDVSQLGTGFQGLLGAQDRQNQIDAARLALGNAALAGDTNAAAQLGPGFVSYGGLTSEGMKQ